MRMKTLIILLLLLGVLAGTAAILVYRNSSQRTAKVLGSRLLPSLPVNEVASLTVRSARQTVSMLKKEGGWVVEERFSYPADFGKIADLVRTLKEAKVGREFAGSDETLGRLALREPDDPGAADNEKGTRLLLKDDKQKVLASVILGEQRQADLQRGESPGRYVRLGKEPTVYLIDEQFATVGQQPQDWLDAYLLKTAAAEVKRISCIASHGNKVLYAFVRSEKGKDLQPLGLPASKEINQYALKQLAGALAYLRVEDVVRPAPEAPAAADFPYRLDYELFNGTIYRIYPGKGCSETEPCRLRLEIDYRQPPPGPEKPAATSKSAETKSEAQTPPPEKPEELARQAAKLNERLSPWLYQVTRWQHLAFATDLDSLLEKQVQPPPLTKKAPLSPARKRQ
jgi:hypothetical protein